MGAHSLARDRRRSRDRGLGREPRRPRAKGWRHRWRVCGCCLSRRDRRTVQRTSEDVRGEPRSTYECLTAARDRAAVWGGGRVGSLRVWHGERVVRGQDEGRRRERGNGESQNALRRGEEGGACLSQGTRTRVGTAEDTRTPDQAGSPSSHWTRATPLLACVGQQKAAAGSSHDQLMTEFIRER